MCADYDFDLGTCSFHVSTQSAEAQRWFDRGLVWCYAFAHEEAVHCFRRATEHDPDCAMAWWGIGYASGPYYNKPWEKFDPVELETTLSTVRTASRQALDRIGNAAPVERALVEALAHRYPLSEPDGGFGRWNDDYADAMREVYRSFSSDSDVCALFAEALMNRTPWALWNLETGEPAEGADTVEALEVLEDGIAAREAAGEADHPGLLHMYIHVLEMCPNPERALRAADRLRELVPDAGHLLHMPTHIDIQCGYYQAVVDWNARACAADRKLFEGDEDPGVWHTMSFAHNYHFMLYGAMFLGQHRAAKQATEGILKAIPESVLRVESPPMADWLEGFVAMQVHAPIRFGRWREIIAMPLPQDRTLYCATTAMLHYAKGLAHAVLEDVPAAEAERELIRSRGSAGAGLAHRVQQHLRRHPRHRGADAARRGVLPQGRARARVRASESGDTPLRGSALRRTLGMDAAGAARAWRPPSGTGASGGGGSGLSGRSGARRIRAPGVPASRERVEPARLSRMPRSPGEAIRGRHGGAEARPGARENGRADRILLPVPASLRVLPILGSDRVICYLRHPPGRRNTSRVRTRVISRSGFQPRAGRIGAA